MLHHHDHGLRHVRRVQHSNGLCVTGRICIGRHNRDDVKKRRARSVKNWLVTFLSITARDGWTRKEEK
jgi:hypothetical protein